MKRVLAITDIGETRNLLVSGLANQCDLVIAGTVEDGIALLKHHHPDIVMLEHNPTKPAMNAVHELISRQERMLVLVMAGRYGWPQAIRELRNGTITSACRRETFRPGVGTGVCP